MGALREQMDRDMVLLGRFVRRTASGGTGPQAELQLLQQWSSLHIPKRDGGQRRVGILSFEEGGGDREVFSYPDWVPARVA
jgi:hypothetical protein